MVVNSFGRQALACMLDLTNMPTMCAAYPIATELSFADFWHTRGKDDHAIDLEKFVVVRSSNCEGFSTPPTKPSLSSGLFEERDGQAVSEHTLELISDEVKVGNELPDHPDTIASVPFLMSLRLMLHLRFCCTVFGSKSVARAVACPRVVLFTARRHSTATST